jgi:hypothetical protein
MRRGEWRNPDYLAWWWRTQVSPDTKIVAAVVAIGLLGIGGYVAANGLEGSVGGSEAGGDQVELVTTTVRKVVTVEKSGKTVTAPARVVAQRVPGGGAQRAPGGGVVTNRVTQVRVATVAGRAGTRVVTQREVVPVVRREQVTVAGGVRTVVQQAPGETVVRTVERQVERPVDKIVERVVTQERVVTVPVQVPVTRTVTETVVVTVATPPVTITAGPITLTITLPLPIPIPGR